MPDNDSLLVVDLKRDKYNELRLSQWWSFYGGQIYTQIFESIFHQMCASQSFVLFLNVLAKSDVIVVQTNMDGSVFKQWNAIKKKMIFRSQISF